jgi:hypothetical protein
MEVAWRRLEGFKGLTRSNIVGVAQCLCAAVLFHWCVRKLTSELIHLLHERQSTILLFLLDDLSRRVAQSRQRCTSFVMLFDV